MSPLDRPWRVGRKVGRTIYMQWGEEPSAVDVLIGMMDDASVAGEACAAHNDRLSRRISSDQGVQE